MPVKDYIKKLEYLINDLKRYDPNLPCEIIVTMSCNNTDERGYSSNHEMTYSSLSSAEETEYNKLTKKRELKKVWITVD